MCAPELFSSLPDQDHFTLIACSQPQAAVDSVCTGQAEYAALMLRNLADVGRLCTTVLGTKLYINEVVPYRSGQIVLLSKYIFERPQNVITIAFSVSSQPGSIAQALSVLSDCVLNIDTMRLQNGNKPPLPENLFFVDFDGSFSGLRERSALIQLQSEMPYFRLMGCRSGRATSSTDES